MASYLSYAPAAIFDSSVADYSESALGLSKLLLEKNIPSMLIERKPSDDLDKAGRVAELVLSREILPVVRFYPTDRSPQFRNLHESSVLGIVDLIWADGAPAFEIGDLLGFLRETWKSRVPLDFNLFFGGKLPSQKVFESFAGMIESVMKRNKNAQIVKLCEIPDWIESDEDLSRMRGFWRMIQSACPDSEPALSPKLWAKFPILREGVYDLGLDAFVCDDNCENGYKTGEIKMVEPVAREEGLPVFPRLPLTVKFYKRSWFAIDVGKVLSILAERHVFNPYMERPRQQPK